MTRRRHWPLDLLRIFFGAVYLTNGIAKVTPVKHLLIGPWRTFLIDYDSSRSILSSDLRSSIPAYRDVITATVLPHYQIFGHILAGAEIAVGLALILGVLGRFAAGAGALLTLNVQLAAIGAGEWTYEYLVELVPLIYLALVPCGHLPALDRVPPLRRLLTPGW